MGAMDGVFDLMAKKEGGSVEEVRSEMEVAIAVARVNKNPAIRELWRTIPYKDEIPTPEEVIAFVMQAISDSRGSF